MTSIAFLTEAIISETKNLYSFFFFFFFFFTFSEFRFNFEHFQKKDDPQSWCIFKLQYSENRG